MSVYEIRNMDFPITIKMEKSLKKLYNEWLKQSFPFVKDKFRNFSCDHLLETAKLSKRQRLWLEVHVEMCNLNDEEVFYAEKNGDNPSRFTDLISKYIEKELWFFKTGGWK